MSAIRTVEFVDAHVGKLRVVLGVTLTVVGVYLLALLLSTIHVTIPAKSAAPSSVDSQTVSADSESPNAITDGMATAATAFRINTYKTGIALNNSLLAVEIGAAKTGTVIVHGGVTLAHTTQSSLFAVGRGLGKSAMFIGKAPTNVYSSVSRIANVGNVIKPANFVQIPVIDPAPDVLLAPQAKVPAAEAPQPVPSPVPPADNTASWPIHGTVTTLFGVPELPYQAIHTGMDISDGKRPGITPVHPFKPGRVLDVIHSSAGLGNHIVIDHGNGLTSVYGHLFSTAVVPGQQVDKNTTLGLEGTTGVSTGTHLHFEIRVNGQATNPQLFISGQP